MADDQKNFDIPGVTVASEPAVAEEPAVVEPAAEEPAAEEPAAEEPAVEVVGVNPPLDSAPVVDPNTPAGTVPSEDGPSIVDTSTIGN